MDSSTQSSRLGSGGLAECISDNTRMGLSYYSSRRKPIPRPASLAQLLEGYGQGFSGCDSSDCSVCHRGLVDQADRSLAGNYSSCSAQTTRKRRWQNASDPDLTGATSKAHPTRTPADSMNEPTSKRQHATDFYDDSNSSECSEDPQLVPEQLSDVSTRWVFLEEDWERSDPLPAALKEVCCFSKPGGTSSTDIVCGVEFDPSGALIACAGVSKQVLLYSFAGFMDDPVTSSEHNFSAPVSSHRMPSKVSSICWSPDLPGVLTVGDYDGVVSQVHVTSGHYIAELDEHAGRRVWCVTHSKLQRYMCMSTAEDGTAKLWAGRGLTSCAATIQPPSRASICSADFSPEDEHCVALASADHNVYLYDLRRVDQPLQTLSGHAGPVSYVRFLSGQRLVSSSTDATVVCWDLAQEAQMGAGQVPHKPLRTWSGHRNVRNFCGLSVRSEDNLVACGSEGDSAYVYHMAWSPPLASHSLLTSGVQSSPRSGARKSFVSAVCWQPYSAGARLPVLASATSDGDVRVFALHSA